MNIIVAEDNKLISQSIGEDILKVMPHANIIYANNGIEVLQLILTSKVSVIIMDIDMPRKNGLETTIEALIIDKSLKIVCTSSYKSNLELINMKILGVVGFVQKCCSEQEYLKAIETVTSGKLYFAAPILEQLKEKGFDKQLESPHKNIADFKLTDIQTRVLSHICQRKTNKQIADLLSVGERSIEKYVQKLLTEFECASRAQLTEHIIVRHWFKNIK